MHLLTLGIFQTQVVREILEAFEHVIVKMIT